MLAIFAGDQGVITQSENDYVGAYEAYLDKNAGRITRSFMLPLQAIVNPFGIFFDTRKLVVPFTTWGATLLTIQGLCSDVLLLMTVLSIRRRFKTE